MSLPTANEVTNIYLYGQETTPIDKVDDSLIRPIGTISMSVDAVEYMQGPGRFALAAMSDLVKKFFTSQDIPGVVIGTAYTFDKNTIAQKLGLDSYGITIRQYEYDDGQDDYAERVYIWNTTQFKLSDAIQFVIDADGTRHIENLSIVPKYDFTESDDDKKENFDFNGGDWATNLGNDLLLEPEIDPSGIGRKVIFEIINTDNIPVKNGYYWEDYQAELTLQDTWSKGMVEGMLDPIDIINMYNAVMPLAGYLWDTGVTRFLDSQARPILYGTTGNDELSASKAKDFDQFEQYSQNGTVLLGGAGNDILGSGTGNDIMIGGDGTDTYIWSAGDGSDTIVETREADGRIHGIIKHWGLDAVAAGGFVRDGASDVWVRQISEGVAFVLAHGASWTLSLPGGGTLTLGEDFRDGDFGINLLDPFPTAPQAVAEPQLSGIAVAGDLAPMEFFDGNGNLYYRYDAWGNAIVDPSRPESGREDRLYDTAANDRLQGLGGNDELLALNGGEDWLEGGAGEDWLRGVAGSDLLEGGTGSDALFGGTENDPFLAWRLAHSVRLCSGRRVFYSRHDIHALCPSIPWHQTSACVLASSQRFLVQAKFGVK